MQMPHLFMQMPHLFTDDALCRQMPEIKSNWLVISEAGNAVCGVV